MFQVLLGRFVVTRPFFAAGTEEVSQEGFGVGTDEFIPADWPSIDGGRLAIDNGHAASGGAPPAVFGLWRKEDDEARDDDDDPEQPDPFLMAAKTSKHNSISSN